MDSNLLLLLVVGLWNPRTISTSKRLSGYTYKDFDLLRGFLATFERVITTGHILAEVSNLAGASTGQARMAIFGQLASLIESMDERDIPSIALCSQAEFLPFGLTDAALSFLCLEVPLVTADGRLAAHLKRRGLLAITMQDIRDLRANSTDND